MKYKNYQEYLNTKGKLAEPVVDASGDQIEKSTKSDKASKSPPSQKGQKDGKGFGDMGDKDLIIKVDIEGKGKKAAKIPTAEFAKYEFLPLIRETIEADPLITEDIVRELKRGGLLGPLVAELLEHRETYQHLAEVMGHDTYGPDVCRRLVRAMKEEVAPPFAASDEDEEDNEDFINRDTSDGEGVDDDDIQDPEELENPEDADELQDGTPNVPPPNPTVPGPAMTNLQQAMNRR